MSEASQTERTSLTSASRGQGLPPGLSTVQILSSSSLGLPGPLGGIEFDPSGSILYIAAAANLAGGGIWSLPVNRHPVTGQIMSFGSPFFITPAPFVVIYVSHVSITGVDKCI